MKKESINRGYMTPEEVRGHLDYTGNLFRDSCENTDYLHKVLERGTLSQGTRKSVYEVLCETYLERDNKHLDYVYKLTKKLGMDGEKYLPQILDAIIEEGKNGKWELEPLLATDLAPDLGRGDELMTMYLDRSFRDTYWINASHRLARKMGDSGNKYLKSIFYRYLEDMVHSGQNRMYWDDQIIVEGLAKSLDLEKDLLGGYIKASFRKTLVKSYFSNGKYMLAAATLAKKLKKEDQKRVLDIYIQNGNLKDVIEQGIKMGLEDDEILALITKRKEILKEPSDLEQIIEALSQSRILQSHRE